MGYDLMRRPLKKEDIGEFRFNMHAWPLALMLAERYGWKGEGTHAPRFDANGGITGKEYAIHDADWRSGYSGDELPRGYMMNMSQVVTASDAAAIADALESALAHLSDEEKIFPVDPKVEALAGRLLEKAVETGSGPDWAIADLMNASTRPAPDDVDPEDYFSGQMKEKIRNFIVFCRGGEFLIG